jgi:two-component system response regulator (stage 0 sporulation protein F)
MSTILIVDDEPDCLLSLTDTLHRSGYEVIALQDGHAALSALAGGARVDLVITEYQLAGMDGLDFIGELSKAAPSVPSIMLTAHGTIEMYLKALNLGVYEFINKPVRTTEIIRIVKAAMEKQKHLTISTKA